MRNDFTGGGLSLHIKIYGGTPAAENLCDSCTHLRVIKGHRESHEIRRCNGQPGEPDPPVPFPVAECSYFSRKDPRYYGDGLILALQPSTNRLMVRVGMSLFSEKWVTIDEYRGVSQPDPEPKTEVVQ